MSGTVTFPPWAYVLLGALLLAQALWIYQDAAKRGERKLLWGLLGLMNVPSSLIVYLLVTRSLMQGKRCPSCGARIGGRDRFCRQCGAAQEPSR